MPLRSLSKSLLFVTLLLLSLGLQAENKYPAATFKSPRDTFRYFLKTMKGYKLGDEGALDLALKALDLRGFSKTILEKYNIRDKVDMILEKGQIIIKPLSKPRKGWEKAFKEMSENEDDKLLFNDVFDDENLDEWK
jgi:antitoxin MazE